LSDGLDWVVVGLGGGLDLVVLVGLGEGLDWVVRWTWCWVGFVGVLDLDCRFYSRIKAF
jgi:hypothetical protein